MKSKKKQRLLALILSMVLMLSASISAMAEGEVPAEASGTETTENQAAAQSLGEEAVPETEVTTEENGIAAQAAELTEEPVQEETEQEITEVPAENTETQAAAQSLGEEAVPETEVAEIDSQTSEISEESVQEATEQETSVPSEKTADPVQEAADETAETEMPTTEEITEEEILNAEEQPAETTTTETTAEEQPAETPEEILPEEVISEAAELKQEFTDENGNVTQTVTAYVPEGTFQATADQISMEVSLLDTDDTNYIKGMMEELLPENYYLDGYVLYQIDFKVNGEITQPAKAVTISMTGNDLAVEDIQKAHVFYYDPEDPEVEDDEDQLAEVIQKDQLIKSLEESGESTENIEDYDYSEITVNEGNADTITIKGWESTIYGCYVEKEAEPVELKGEAEDIQVTLSGPASSFPQEGELALSVKKVDKETKKIVKEAIEEEAENSGQEVVDYTALDITLLYNGEEIQPLGPVNVTFTKQDREKDAEEVKETKVFHVDEEKGTATDMEAAVNTSGEAEIETTHFSVYVVVDLDQLGGKIKVKVEHYAINLKQLTPTGNTPQGGNEGLMKTGGSNWAPQYTVSSEEKQIYKDDTIELDNGLKTPVENLSKICMSNVGKSNVNYKLTKIRVTDSKSEKEYNAGSDEEINLTDISTIRMIYEPESSGDEVTLQTPVQFYDYDVSDGKLITSQHPEYSNNQGYNTDHKGINSAGNFSGGGDGQNNQLKFGFRSNGFFHSSSSDTNLHLPDPTTYLNEINTDRTGDKTGFVVRTGIVRDKLDANGNLQFSNGIYAPNLFGETSGRDAGVTTRSNYNLGFIQEGDTYTLSQVYKGSDSVLSNLQHIRKIIDDVYANNFWPLDTDKATDPLFGGNETANKYGLANDGFCFNTIGFSDDEAAHNWYFGMKYEFTFTLGDYVGPLNFYFRGDDDFWLYVDGEKKIDLGGLHSSVGQYLDLEYLRNQPADKEHTITIYYMERGGYGSSCYMQFTLPNVKPVDFDTTVEKTSVTVNKVWEDHNSPSRPASASITLQYKKDGESSYRDYETVTLSQANNWTYTWPNMPKTGYIYRVVEKNVPEGYRVSYTNQDLEGGGILLPQSGSEGSFSGTVTNTADPYTWIEVKKQWNDGNNAAGTRPDQVQFQLYYKTADTDSWQIYPGGLLELTESSGWEGKYDKLPVYADKDKDTEVKYQYSVREVSNNQDLRPGDKLPGKNNAQYTVSYPEGWYVNGQWIAYEAKPNDITADLTVTNSMGIMIQVKKEWKGVQKKPDTVIYAGLYKDNSPVKDFYVKLDDKNGFTDKFQYLTPGKYTVKELRPVTGEETPEFTNIEGKGYIGINTGGKVTISDITYDVDYETKSQSSDQQETTITNTAHWQIIKQSSSDGNMPLKDAVFTLTGSNGNSSAVYTGTSDSNGVVQWEDKEGNPFTGIFLDGTYTLKETQVPQGYKLNTEVWKIEISNGVPVKINDKDASGSYVNGILTFYYENVPMYELPSAGGDGIFRYIAAGVLCMVGASWIFWYRRRVSFR